MVLFLLAYLVFICNMDKTKNVAIDEISKQMGKVKAITELEKCGSNELKRYYGVDGSAYDGYFFYKAESPMAVEEILIVKVKDSSQKDSLLETMESHLQSQKKSFEGYGVEQTALLNKAIVEVKGNYGIYCAGKDAENWKQKFYELVK